MRKLLPLILIIVIVVAGGYLLLAKNNQTTSISGMHQGDMMGSPVVQSHHTYSLHLISALTNHQPNQTVPITYTITDETGNVLKDFLLDHTKLMHFIVLRHDLQNFQHLHPDFNKDTGVFSVPVTFPESGTYRLFADFTPTGAQKDDKGNDISVTPFQDVQIGSTYSLVPVVADFTTTKTVGKYTIAYNVPKEIATKTPITISMQVSQDGQPVTQFESYLGAKAHGILIKKDTFDFTHLHDMSNMNMQGNSMMGNENMHEMNARGDSTNKGISFTYTFPNSGMYKLFSQFQIQGQVITTDYTFRVK